MIKNFPHHFHLFKPPSRRCLQFFVGYFLMLHCFNSSLSLRAWEILPEDDYRMRWKFFSSLYAHCWYYFFRSFMENFLILVHYKFSYCPTRKTRPLLLRCCLLDTFDFSNCQERVICGCQLHWRCMHAWSHLVAQSLLVSTIGLRLNFNRDSVVYFT